MAAIGLLPAIAIAIGAALGLVSDGVRAASTAAVTLVIIGWVGWCARRNAAVTTAAVCAGFLCAAFALAADARTRAFHTPLRSVLEGELGGFAVETLGPGARHDPIPTRVRLLEDSSWQDQFASVRAAVTAIRLGNRWRATGGDVTLTVTGRVAADRSSQWRAGQTVETFATFHRPSRYLNDGVPDFEQQLALDGITLFGSVKSGLLVEQRTAAGVPQEWAGRVRAHVRHSVAHWVTPHSSISGAIVTAVLIGDRTGLPDVVRLRLQAAGTYHVIAISGGNIAILAALTVGALLVCGISGRRSAVLTILLLVAYGQVVTAGPSVWRATLMAIVYLSARVLDHRTPPWQAIAMAAGLVLAVQPLDVRDVGFVLTFGATAALLEGARRISSRVVHSRSARWLLTSVVASLAVELVLLPVNAWAFSRVTSAGLVLNLLAVPLMGLIQVCGIAVCLVPALPIVAAPAGWLAHTGAQGLIDSARLVDVAPALSIRVPPPSAVLIAVYYVGLGGVLIGRRMTRVAAVVMMTAAAAAIVTGEPATAIRARDLPPLRMTTFDVGQADATLLQLPDRSTLLVDAGGTPFGGGFDIGGRVLSPALWARGVRHLDGLLLTHGDPDHIGGARAIVDDFAPSLVWEGVPVMTHEGMHEILQHARDLGARVEQTFTGTERRMGEARLRVLHPSPPDWERPRVRNDDSVVVEVVYGDVAVLLLGDVGAAVERTLLPRLSAARHRILKVAHHGSQTSSSRELLEGWRPQIAVISCGRGNTFGHPTPEVLARLQSIGAAVYRTDLHGQITIDTDGKDVHVRTYVDRNNRR